MDSIGLQGHIVIATVEYWGHTRSFCTFASRIVITRAVHVTLFTTARLLDRVKTEVSRSFGPHNADRQGLIRILTLDTLCPPAPTMTEQLRLESEKYFTSFPSAYKQLTEGKSVKCAVTGVSPPTIPVPHMVIVDFTLGPLIQTIQNIGKKPAKVIGFMPVMLSAMYMLFAPAEKGGRGNFRVKAQAKADKTGRPLLEVADEMFHDFDDGLTQVPGLPPMYRYEHDPQEISVMTKSLLGPMFLSIQDTFTYSDGIILTTPDVYEPKAVAAMKDWYAETSRPVLAVGPVLPSTTSTQAMAAEGMLSKDTAEILDFMNSVLKSHGEHSMLYISFGSLFFPLEPEKLEAFVDVMIERKIPFILSHGAEVAQMVLSEGVRKKVEASGLGLLSPWTPQQTILAHPVLGWFVTHCGQNGTIEALSSGVPLICWPFHSDQAVNAVNITENLDAGYELMEVRTGNGLRPRYRTGKGSIGTVKAIRAEAHEVLEKAFGSDGARKRANAKRLQEEMAAAWAKGGIAEKEMERLFDSLDV